MIKCSVIVLNYFGETVLTPTINSLLKQDFPKSEYEIIIVDNGSTDNSIQVINTLAKKHPQIRKLFLHKNLGFAAGNNRGIKIAKGEYICLLNNDCLANTDWLSKLYQTAISDNNIFSVASKILLYPKYFQITIPQNSTDVIVRTDLTASNLLNYSKTKFLKIPFSTTNNFEYLLNIPYDPMVDKQVKIEIKYAETVSVQTVSYLQKSSSITHLSQNAEKLFLEFSTTNPHISSKSYRKLQNAGSIIFPDGYSRDIGAVVKNMSQDYETDEGQFDKTKPVYSSCGAAVLYSRKILNKIGLLDENFFMYYEDLEISERALLQGYKNTFCPKAVVNHLHALSSHEWSNFFIYHTERGRLIHLLLHFPLIIFLREYIKFSLKAAAYIYYHQLTYLKVSLNIFSQLPLLAQKRLQLQKNRPTNAVDRNYHNIISGYWYVH